MFTHFSRQKPVPPMSSPGRQSRSAPTVQSPGASAPKSQHEPLPLLVLLVTEDSLVDPLPPPPPPLPPGTTSPMHPDVSAANAPRTPITAALVIAFVFMAPHSATSVPQ